MAVYTLPDLPYDYTALEPAISGKIMELHHDKHHKAYVDAANTTLDKLEAARAGSDFASIVGLQKTLAFNLAGHANHTIFWKNMGPDGHRSARWPARSRDQRLLRLLRGLPGALHGCGHHDPGLRLGRTHL